MPRITSRVKAGSARRGDGPPEGGRHKNRRLGRLRLVKAVAPPQKKREDMIKWRPGNKGSGAEKGTPKSTNAIFLKHHDLHEEKSSGACRT